MRANRKCGKCLFLSKASLFLVALLSRAVKVQELPEPVPLSQPKWPLRVKYYPVSDFLSCEGKNFSSSWREFRLQLAANARLGYPRDDALLEVAKGVFQTWEPLSVEGSKMHVRVLLKDKSVVGLDGFCLYGYATALFVLYRHLLAMDFLESIRDILGWSEWPLDFSESSGWPALWRSVPVHLEYRQMRGDTSWSADLGSFDWGSEGRFLPRPSIGEMSAQLHRWLQQVGGSVDAYLAVSPHRFDLKPLTFSAAEPELLLRILVAGHHLGSSMEPYSMLRRALGAKMKVLVQFHGQRHPAPNIMCLEFHYCNENRALEDWFRKYESRWIGVFDWMIDSWDEALQRLGEVIRTDTFLRDADCLVCGGPAWFCGMMRTIQSKPVLLYFAWAIVPMVPQHSKTHLLAHLQALGRTTEPPTIFLVANWVLAAQFALQVHMAVPVLRPHGLYVNQTYAPRCAPNGFQRILFSRLGQWSGQAGPALLELLWDFVSEEQKLSELAFPFELVFLSVRVRGIEPILHLRYDQLVQFYACVFVPWDIMMLMFNELYTLTMPLLVPERQWMRTIMLHALQHTEMNWWHIRTHTVQGALPVASTEPFPLPLPWIDGTTIGVQAAAYWYELTDFSQFPHITYFDSIPHLLSRIKTLNVPAIRRGMRAFNRVTLQKSLAFYGRAASRLFEKKLFDSQ